MLYNESRRKKILASASAAFVDKVNPAAWHSYDIVVKRPSISTRLNGGETVRYVENDAQIAKTSEFIALQAHAHPRPIEVWFRDV